MFFFEILFFFLRRRAHRRQTTVFTTPKRVLTSVFSVFALLNQPRFAFQPASFHFIQFQKISRFHSNPQGPHSHPDSQHTLFKSPSPIVNAWPGVGHARGPGGQVIRAILRAGGGCRTAKALRQRPPFQALLCQL